MCSFSGHLYILILSNSAVWYHRIDGSIIINHLIDQITRDSHALLLDFFLQIIDKYLLLITHTRKLSDTFTFLYFQKKPHNLIFLFCSNDVFGVFFLHFCIFATLLVNKKRKQVVFLVLWCWDKTWYFLSLLNACRNFTGNKLKVGWTKIVDKMKSKKAKKKKVKKMEQELVMRIMSIQENEEDGSSREGSIHSLQDSERVRLPILTWYTGLEMAVPETWQTHCHPFLLNTYRRTAIWRTIWRASKKTWWNSSYRMRCGVWAAGVSASLKWVINIGDSVECLEGLLSVRRGSVNACPQILR